METNSRTAKNEERWLEEMAGPEQWRPTDAERVIAAWQASGKSMAEFSDGYGINPQRIAWWRKRLATKEVPAAPAMQFVPVTVRAQAERPATAPAERSVAPVVIALGGVGRIEVAEPEAVSPSWIAALVSELAQAGGAL